jgi:hypothetical protein
VARAKVAAKPATFPRVYTISKRLPLSTEKHRKGIFESNKKISCTLTFIAAFLLEPLAISKATSAL